MLPYLLLLISLAATLLPTAGRGSLTLVVRDQTGQPLPGVQLGIIHDGDAGRVEMATAITDRAGTVALPDLAWGLYIVQFRGAAPNGQPIAPPAAQNLGLLSDGAGAEGGFGIRFATPARTVLFVIDLVPGAPHAVPMFDLAPDGAAPPDPVPPVRATRDGTSDPVQPRVPQHSRWGIVLLGLPLMLTGAALGLGWLRSQAARRGERPAEEEC